MSPFFIRLRLIASLSSTCPENNAPVTLATIDELKPAVVRAVGVDEFLYLLMPVRVS